MTKMQELEAGMKAYKWWDATPPPKGTNWTYLEHAGVTFPAPFKRHNIKMLYDGEVVTASFS